MLDRTYFILQCNVMRGQQNLENRSKILPRERATELLKHTGLFSSPPLLLLVTVLELFMVHQQSVHAKCGERCCFHSSYQSITSLWAPSTSRTGCGTWHLGDTWGQGHGPCGWAAGEPAACGACREQRPQDQRLDKGVAFLGVASRQSEETHDVPTVKVPPCVPPITCLGALWGRGYFSIQQ